MKNVEILTCKNLRNHARCQIFSARIDGFRLQYILVIYAGNHKALVFVFGSFGFRVKRRKSRERIKPWVKRVSSYTATPRSITRDVETHEPLVLASLQESRGGWLKRKSSWVDPTRVERDNTQCICYHYFNIVSYCNYFHTTPQALSFKPYRVWIKDMYVPCCPRNDTWNVDSYLVFPLKKMTERSAIISAH